MPTPNTSADKAPAPTPPAPKSKGVEPAFALHRINGVIEPGTMFRPETKKDRDEMETLEAIRDLSAAERAVFEKTEQPVDTDPLG